MTVVAVVLPGPSAIARAIPKSITLTEPFRPSITLAGLMSRWTMPCRWEKSRAAQISAAICRARCGGTVPSSASTSCSVRPSTYSITM